MEVKSLLENDLFKQVKKAGEFLSKDMKKMSLEEQKNHYLDLIRVQAGVAYIRARIEFEYQKERKDPANVSMRVYAESIEKGLHYGINGLQSYFKMEVTEALNGLNKQ